MAVEYRTVSFMQPTKTLLGDSPGGACVQTLNFLTSVPELAEHMDGWDLVNTQIVPFGEYSYLVFTLRMELDPDGLL